MSVSTSDPYRADNPGLDTARIGFLQLFMEAQAGPPESSQPSRGAQTADGRA